MKKSVLYVVDVTVDKEGAVLECQCECVVGTGPDAHCKHLQCVLYGLVCFAEIHEVVIKETCTGTTVARRCTLMRRGRCKRCTMIAYRSIQPSKTCVPFLNLQFAKR